MDPVRYKIAGEKDFILMLGVELRSYDIANQYCGQIYRDSGVRTSPLRGIGYTANKFVTEAFLDEVALKRGIDAVQLRLELLKNTPRGRAVVERVAQMANWGEKPEDGRGFGFAFIDYSNSLLGGIAEISVNRASGQIKVHNFWCAFDCGVPVQPDNVVAQTESSIVYGLGMALTERISIKDGAVEQSNFYDYQVMRMRDMPQMHIEILATDNHPTGAGQMATAGGARHQQCFCGLDEQATTRNADDARARQEGAGMTAMAASRAERDAAHRQDRPSPDIIA